jgi:hypothetical protein
MNPNEVVGLSMFLQKNADGSQFVSCEGQVDGKHVSFTVSDYRELAPILTGVIIPVGTAGTRFVLERKATGGLTLVGMKEVVDADTQEPVVKDVNGVAVHSVKYARIQLISAPTVDLALTVRAPRKPAVTTAPVIIDA